MEFAPNHFEARKCLSTILHQLGRFDEALHTLTQDEEAELLNPTLLYERCQLLLAGKFCAVQGVPLQSVAKHGGLGGISILQDQINF